MCPVGTGVEPRLLYLAVKDPGLPASAEVTSLMYRTGEQAIARQKPCFDYPCRDRVSCRTGDFELNRALRLLLHDRGSSRNLTPVANVAHLQLEKIAAAELAVNSKVEERQFSRAMFQLEPNSDRPDILESNGAFWPTILPLFHGAR